MEPLNYSGLLQSEDNRNIEPEIAEEARRISVESYEFKLNCQLAYGVKFAVQLVLTLTMESVLFSQPKLRFGCMLAYFIVLLICFYSGSWDLIFKSMRNQLWWFGLIAILESIVFCILCSQVGLASYLLYFPLTPTLSVLSGLYYKIRGRYSPYAQTVCLILYTTSMIGYICYAWSEECQVAVDFLKVAVLAVVPVVLYRSWLSLARCLFKKKVLERDHVLVASLPGLCILAVVRRL